MNQDLKEKLQKTGCAVLCALWLFNLVGGTITHFFTGNGAFGVSNLIISIAVYPTVKGWFSKLT